MAGRDRFNPAHYGIFAGGEGLAEFEDMDTDASPDYYAMARTCEVCGRPKELQIPWYELYCLQYGVDPALVGRHTGRSDIFDTQWAYNRQLKCLHPDVRCPCIGGSGQLVIFNMTPTEAERQLSSAGRNGIISQQQQEIIRAIAPVVKQLAQVRSGVPSHQVQQAYAQARPGQPVAGVPAAMPVQGGMRRR